MDRERIEEITRRTNEVLSLSPLDRSPVGEWPEMMRDVLAALAAAEAENARLRRGLGLDRLPTIGYDCVLLNALARRVHRAISREHDYTALKETRRGQSFEVKLDDGRIARVVVELDRVEAALASGPTEEEACDRCHGDGVITVGGASVNPHTGALGPDPQAAEDVTCPDCGGSGVAPRPGEGAAT